MAPEVNIEYDRYDICPQRAYLLAGKTNIKHTATKILILTEKFYKENHIKVYI